VAKLCYELAASSEAQEDSAAVFNGTAANRNKLTSGSWQIVNSCSRKIINNIIFSIPLKQQQNGLKPIKPRVYGRSKATTGRDAATN
jgi:hypothetical protein